MTAAALAVSRSCELPRDHHGGPIHPIAGIHATHQLAGRLDGEWGYVPVIQSVALANKHIHTPEMGPTAMAAIEPAEDNGDVDAMLDDFAAALVGRQSRQAERLLAALVKTARPDRILNAMLAVGLRQNALDDHFFLYPLFAIRALDDIGWEWAETVLRPPVRYLSRHPMVEPLPGFRSDFVIGGIALYRRFGELEALIDEFDLTEGNIVLEATADETGAIAALAETIGHVDDILTIGRLVAEGIGGGLSLAGAGEALSIGGAMLFLRSRSGQSVRRPHPYRHQRPALPARPRRHHLAPQGPRPADLGLGQRGSASSTTSSTGPWAAMSRPPSLARTTCWRRLRRASPRSRWSMPSIAASPWMPSN